MHAVIETVDQWLRHMSLDWETPVSLDEDGTCNISAANGFSLEMYVVPATGMCHMGIHLTDVPLERREEFYATLLYLNIHQQETQGATLAVDPVRQTVLLCFAQPVAALTAEFFYNLIQNLIIAAESLTQHIEAAVLQGPVGAAGADDDDDTDDDEDEDQGDDDTDGELVDPGVAYQPPAHHFGHLMSLV